MPVSARTSCFEPEQIAQLQTRMNLWLELKRSCGGNVGAVLAERDEIRRRLEVQGDLEGALTRLDRQIADAGTTARRQAEGAPSGAGAGGPGTGKGGSPGNRSARIQETPTSGSA